MNQVTVDEGLKDRLKGLAEQTELFDESGRKLGYFLPADVYRDLLNALVDAEFSEDELERACQQTDGRSLAEILKTLGRP
jgi:hypothetical protein